MPKEAHQIVIRPVVTEKAYSLQAENTYTFEVAHGANKGEIKDAIEELFDVKVVDVRTIPKRGKVRRRGWKSGRTRRWKKAMVKLAPENTLDIM